MIIKITEEQYRYFINASDLLREDVFTSDIDTNQKVANITYLKGGSSKKRNAISGDFLKTDKMDNSGHDTYIVPLKGGIVSYNITSISGTEVMHYFKNYFERGGRKNTTIKVGDEKYKLDMQEREFNEFMQQFTNKVSNVVNYYINDMKSKNREINFNTLSIYPVKSSSNFNVEMVHRLISNGITINGMQIRQVNSEILDKDLSKIEKDEDFLKKNAEYYNSRQVNKRGENHTHMQALDRDFNMLSKYPDIAKQINIANEYTTSLRDKKRGKLLKQWDYVKKCGRENKLTPKAVNNFYNLFIGYQESVKKIVELSEYYDSVNRKNNRRQLRSVANAVKNTKGPSVELRKNEMYDFLQHNGYRGNLPKRNELYDVCMWEPVKFQIKKFTNDTRIGLRNLFKFDEEKLQAEIDNIKNSILVIFDDNISGGATLSDICYQYKKLGIEYMIPITFGKMKESWDSGGFNINKPENGFNFS